MCLHMPYSTPATVNPHVAPLYPLPRTRQVSPPAAHSEFSEEWALKSDVLFFLKDSKGILWGHL